MSLKSKIMQYPNKTEFARYFWAGGLATLADFAVLLLLTEVFDINYLWSNLIAVSVGLVMSYVLCVRWVFLDRRYNRVVLEFPLFVLTCIIGLLLNELLLWIFVEFGGIDYVLAKVIVTGVVFFVNFGVKKVVLFR
jgi:putative flippase GtrA